MPPNNSNSSSSDSKTTPIFNIIGKTIGLVGSIGFLCFTTYFLTTGKVKDMSITEIRIFYTLLILFSGPIAYFWISTGTKFKIRFGLGSFVVVGGYGIAFSIIYIVHILLGPPCVWRHISLDNYRHGIPPGLFEITPISTSGKVFPQPASKNPNSPYQFICYFSPETDNIEIILTFMDNLNGPQKLSFVISRKGDDFQKLDMYKNSKNLLKNDGDS